jgi:hypothetical protein
MNKLGASLIVSSASDGGYGTLRSFDESIGWTVFGPPEIRDPRGVRRRAEDAYVVVNEPSAAVWLLSFDGAALARIDLPPGLDPGGGAFASDGTYYVGSRSQRSIERVDLTARRYRGPTTLVSSLRAARIPCSGVGRGACFFTIAAERSKTTPSSTILSWILWI